MKIKKLIKKIIKFIEYVYRDLWLDNIENCLIKIKKKEDSFFYLFKLVVNLLSYVILIAATIFVFGSLIKS